MKRIFSKISRIIGICFLVFTGIILLFKSPFGEAWLKTKIESEINSREIVCTIENLDINHWITLHFNNIYFSTKDTSAIRMTGTISALTIQMTPKLFHPISQWIDHVQINNPEIAFFKTTEVKKTSSSAETEKNISQNLYSMHLPGVEIHKGILNYQDTSIPLEGEFQDFGFTLLQTLEKNLHLKLHTILQNGKYREHTIPSLKMDCHAILSKDSICLDSLTLCGAGFKGYARAEVNTDTLHPQINVRIHLQGKMDSLQTVHPAFTNFSSGMMDVVCQASGKIDSPEFEAAGMLPDLQINTLKVEQIRFQGRGNLHSLTLDSLSCTLLEGHILANGEYDIASRTYQYSASLEHISLSKLQTNLGLASTDYQGVMEGSLSNTGNLDRLDLNDIHGHIRIFNQSYQNNPLPDASFSLVQERQILRLRSTMRRTQLDGDFIVGQDSVSGQWHLDLKDIKPAAEWFGLDSLSGSLNFTGRILGNYQSPKMHLAIEGHHLKWDHWQCHFLNLSAGMENNNIRIYDGKFVMDSTTFILTGTYENSNKTGSLQTTWQSLDNKLDVENRIDLLFKNKRNGWQLEARSNDLNIQTFDRLPGLKNNISGNMRFQADITGIPHSPRGQLQIKGRNPAYQEIQADSIAMNMTLFGDTLSLDTLKIYSDSGRMSIQGRTDWRSLLDNRFQVFGRCLCDSFPLDIIQDQFVREGQLQGYLSGDIKIQYVDNILLFGSLDILEGSYQQSPQSTVVTDLRGYLIFDGSDFRLENLTGRTGNQSLASQIEIHRNSPGYFSGTGNLHINNQEVLYLNAELTSDSVNCDARLNQITLSSFHTLIPELKWLDATVKGHTSIKGSLSSPALYGELNIEHISLNAPLLKNKWTEGKARILLQNNSILLDTLFIANSKKGNFKAKGDLNLNEDQWIYHLSLAASNVILEKDKSFYFHLKNADFKAQGNSKNGNIIGQISMNESKWLEPLETKKIIPFFHHVEEPSQSPADWMHTVGLNIRCVDCNNLWIDNNVAKIHINTNLELQGTLARPVILGNLKVEEGYAFYLDRKFNIQTGILGFSNPYQIQPDIEVLAKSRLESWETLSQKSYDITLSVTGSLDKPQLVLSSEPALASPDIVSLLTLGATREELTRSGNSGLGLSFTDVLQERAVMYSGQRLTRIASSKLSMWSGLDEITVNGNLFVSSKTWSPRVLASKKINARLKMIYSTEIGHANEQSIRLDYELNKKWSVEGQINQKNQAGLDIKYKIIQ